ncbi:MAG TPA: Ger(x)C family spore germination protein [Bacilli bacterium]
MGAARWRKRIKVGCLILGLLSLLTGCWDRLEIEERAVILGISIDKAEPEEMKEEKEVSHLKGKYPTPKKGSMRITVQIAVPGRIPLGPGETGGGGKGGGQKSVWVLDVVGHTIDDAVMNLQQQISAQLFFGHLRVIVVSQEVAKDGLQDINDYFRRSPEVRRLTWMMISKGKAGELMKATPELERVPTLYLISTMDQAVRMGKFPNDFVGQFWSNSSKKGQEPYLPFVDIEKKGNMSISGMAFFKGEKMVGVTKPLEIGIYMEMLGMNPGGYQAFVEVPGTSGLVVYNVTHRKSNIDVQIKNGKPHITIKNHLEGDLREKSNGQFTLNGKSIQGIENQMEMATEKGFKDLFEKTQKKGSDIFGFGEIVRAKHARYWNKQIKTNKNWQKMFKEITLESSSIIEVRRVGMKAN